jgi:hypothetical protein
MRFFILGFSVITCLCLVSCKKDSGDTPSENINTDTLYQSIFYKTIATVPSPADTAEGLLSDSLRVSRSVTKSNPDFFTNIPNVSSNEVAGYGFSIGYDDPSKSLPYFAFTAYAFPGVPRDFSLNQAYEHYTSPSDALAYQRPMFLGTHTGTEGMTYFVDNIYPPDAEFPSSKTYSRVIFTKKLKIPIPPNYYDTAYYGSGHISGYCIDYYKPSDTAKYRHRWDFTVDFTDLKIDK